MHRFARLAVGAVTVLALSACGGGAASTGTAATQATAASQAAAACVKASEAGSVAAAVKDFSFDPADPSAKVGDTVTWTNTGAVGHTVTVDNQPGCDTGTISAGGTGSLTFSVAGTYPFQCTIHSSMKGTITITG